MTDALPGDLVRMQSDEIDFFEDFAFVVARASMTFDDHSLLVMWVGNNEGSFLFGELMLSECDITAI